MSDEKQQGRVTDFGAFYPTPRNTFRYKDGRSFPAWDPIQLGERDRALIQNIYAEFKACKTAAEQVAVTVDAIMILAPTAPAEELRQEPWEALWGSLLDLLGTTADASSGGEPRPTPAARRKKSGSRRSTAQ